MKLPTWAAGSGLTVDEEVGGEGGSVSPAEQSVHVLRTLPLELAGPNRGPETEVTYCT